MDRIKYAKANCVAQYKRAYECFEDCDSKRIGTKSCASVLDEFANC